MTASAAAGRDGGAGRRPPTTSDGSPDAAGLRAEAPPIDRLLASARARLRRLSPAAARGAAREGGLIVNIRSERDRELHGGVAGAWFIPRNVLEWRVDARCPYHDPILVGARGPLILMCAQGYQSSLAAATLVDLGIANATDMEGGYERWCAEGLPIVPVAAHDGRAAPAPG